MRRTKALLAVATALLDRPDDRHHRYKLSRAAEIRSGVMYPLLWRLLKAGLLTDQARPGQYRSSVQRRARAACRPAGQHPDRARRTPT